MTEPKLYYLWGEDSYRIDQEIAAILKRLQTLWGQEPEVVVINDDEMSPQQLMEALEYSPLFALQRVLIIKRPGFIDKSNRKAARIREFQNVLEIYLNQMPEGQVLIIASNERAATNPIVKLVEKQAQVIALSKLSEAELGEWVGQQFISHGRKASSQLVNRLLRSGQDMYYLKNLIDKLCLMVPSGSIPESCLEGQLESREEVKIFGLIDGLTARRPQRALDAYHRLRGQGEENIAMLAMINRQYQTMAAVKYYQEKGYSKAEIVKTTGQKDYTVRKMMEVTRNYSWEDLQRIFAVLLETDVGMKSSSKDPDLLMEMMLVSCCEHV